MKHCVGTLVKPLAELRQSIPRYNFCGMSYSIILTTILTFVSTRIYYVSVSLEFYLYVTAKKLELNLKNCSRCGEF